KTESAALRHGTHTQTLTERETFPSLYLTHRHTLTYTFNIVYTLPHPNALHPIQHIHTHIHHAHKHHLHTQTQALTQTQAHRQTCLTSTHTNITYTHELKHTHVFYSQCEEDRFVLCGECVEVGGCV